jgi:Asp-tRNA(Asn)/Glu-tRNA(Gln) amidotransferase A subunit family amidase
MARTTADLALLYSAISGQNCPQQPRVEIPNKLTQTLEGKRIGVDVFWSKQSEPSVYKV